MPRVPSYLCQNRHGIFYFRLVIPRRFREHFTPPCRELRFSLRTARRPEAVSRARAHRAIADEFFRRLEPMTKKTDRRKPLKQELIKFTGNFGHLFEIDFDDPDKELAAASRLQREAHELKATGPAPLPSTAPGQPIPPPLPTVTTGLRFSELCDEYLKLKKKRRELTPKTLAEYEAAFEEFKFVRGDLFVAQITREDVEHFYDAILRLPKERNKLQTYANKTAKALLGMELPESARRETGTVNQIFSRVRSLMKYAKAQGHADSDPTEAFVLQKDMKRSRQKRMIFSEKDLEKIFNTDHFKKGKWRRGKGLRKPEPYRFWLLPIGLLTGARQGEILQLHTNDIKQDVDDGIWYFDVNENPASNSGKLQKRVKNSNSLRKIPICQALIDMGLLEFHKEMAERRSVLLFPELEAKDNGKGAAQQWVNRYLAKCGVHEKLTKTFHSLRHTFVNHLVDQGVKANMIGGITGHLDKDEFGQVAELANTYYKGYSVTKLKTEVIEKLELGRFVEGIRWR